MRLPTLRAQNQTFCILELDHPLLFAEQLGVSVADPAGLAHIQQVQGELMRALSPEVSGVVLDSESSYWALEQKAQHTGVVFSLEKQTSESDPLAVPRLAETWGVVPTKNNYALSKLKLAYHPSQKAALQKRQFVAEISEYSHQQGIDFILELDLMHEGEAEQAMLQSISEMRSLVDLWVLPAAQPLTAVTITAQLDVPWIFSVLTEKYDLFKEQLRVALEGGAAGFMVGPALWADVLRAHPGAAAREDRAKAFQTIVRDRFLELARITGEHVAQTDIANT